MKHLSEKALGDLWAAQRKYHGNEPFKVGHLEFVRAAIASDRALNGIGEAQPDCNCADQLDCDGKCCIKQHWVGLTDKEVRRISATIPWADASCQHKFYDAIEAKLREKNAGQPAADDKAVEPVAWDDIRADEIVSGLYRKFKDWSKRGFSADDVTWCEVKAEINKLIEQHTTPPTPAVPDGWHLVPVEPTEEMLMAGTDALYAFETEGAASVYRAMRSAAPNP